MWEVDFYGDRSSSMYFGNSRWGELNGLRCASADTDYASHKVNWSNGLFGNTYKLTYPMVSSGDYHVDDLLLIDVAKFLIQQKTVAGLVSMRKIKQTEEGVGTLVSFINGACDQLANIGMIAGGIWKGDSIVDLNTGDAIENGYLVQAGSVADQSAQDRADRVSPPIYVALLSSGAIEHVVIAVYVNR